MNRPLKYVGTAVCFQEVPDEITVAIEITDCPHRCEGCHSQYMWVYEGRNLMQNFPDILSANCIGKGVSCICFMGGEWRPRELINYCRLSHKLGIKTCLYTGADNLKEIDNNLLSYLDYIKFGSWRENRGPLGDEDTNQRMFKLRDEQNRPAVIDITSKFQKEYL